MSRTRKGPSKPPRHPSLYQINTRVYLSELARALGRPATLDDVADAELDRWADRGFDWIWLLSVWRTGPAGQRVSRTSRDFRREFEETLPDLKDEDIAGSGFAIAGYTVHPSLGGDAALARLRGRLRARGLRLMLDFVPNHTAIDHPWAEDHPEYYVGGTDLDLKRAPQNFTWVERKLGRVLLAHGRDPYFPGWPDTLQLDYGNPATQQAMAGELLKIGEQCDGVRCDMAMLVLPEVFERTWGRKTRPFWPEATARVRQKFPGFTFMAEVYWDLEWAMMQQGFDYAYDKRLYDRLREGRARPVREHLLAGLDFQGKLARFLENHDEPRAAATFAPGAHQAAAVITFLSPGLRFFHQGQLEGRRKHISPHLVRAPTEASDPSLQQFYERLLAVLRDPAVREGRWTLLECGQAWGGNPTGADFLAWSWESPDGRRLLTAVNYSGHRSQCYVRGLAGRTVRLRDRMGPASYDREGSELASRGLYLDLLPWGFHVFDVDPVGT
ncbi:MAG TPA: alpha-amylase family glycosyl hydrolase [Myxococcales bacterium]|nr:alpha-amylase family glycosyl hydrolase [Myxococcales bacterium]